MGFRGTVGPRKIAPIDQLRRNGDVKNAAGFESKPGGATKHIECVSSYPYGRVRSHAIQPADIAAGFVEAHQPVNLGNCCEAPLDRAQRLGFGQADPDRDIGSEKRPRPPDYLRVQSAFS
jgi:hypothetical protein